MPRNVISFMNMKGGVGKTTICVNIAGQLATMNKSVLIIDMDPQMNASQYLLKPSKLEELITNKKTIYNLYRENLEQDIYSMVGSEIEVENEFKPIIQNIRPNLDLICGDLNMTKVKDVDGAVPDILASFIEDERLKERYQFIFIDCPPTQSIYTTSAFKASDFYLIVIKPDYLSTIGLSLFNNIIKNYNSRRKQPKKLHSLGIIANLTQKNNDGYYENKINEIREKFKFYNVFESSITNTSAIAKASENQKLMCETNRCKTPIKRLTKEFIKTYEKEVAVNDK